MKILLKIAKFNLLLITSLHFASLFLATEDQLAIIGELIFVSIILSVVFLSLLLYMRFYAKEALVGPSQIKRIQPALAKIIVFYYLGLICLSTYRGAWAKIITEGSQQYLSTSSGIIIRAISSEEAVQILASKIHVYSAVAIIGAYMAFISICGLSTTRKRAANK